MSEPTPDQRQSVPLPQEDDDKEDDTVSTTSSADSEPNAVVVVNESSLRRKLRPHFFRMLNVCKEIGFMLFVALTYAALTKDPPKVTKSPAAFPFFPHGSVVKDWYRGQITAAIEHARSSDLAFVMFYAPWDAECQVVKGQFEEAARLMSKQASFAAVNCWQPGGECRSHYNKVYYWPVLIVYPAHARGVQYNGPLEARHMIKFLNNVAKPLLRVTKAEELDELLINYDAVIVGHVNALPRSSDYGVLYTAALRLLEKDPHQEIAFAVETHSNTSQPPKLELHLWNETWAYPNDLDWQPEKILSWILKKLHQVTMWSFPPGMKSREFLVHLQQRPALILFTPKNPLRPNTDYYSMLRQVGFEYYNCNSMEPIGYWLQLFREKRYENYATHKELTQWCKVTAHSKRSTLAVTASKQWRNNSSCTLQNVSAKCSCVEDECSRFSCYSKDDIHSRKPEMDPRSPEMLLQAKRLELCRFNLLAEKYYPAIFAPDITDFENESNWQTGIDIEGLACKRNASLALLALDSLQYYHFAERLGIDVLKTENGTAVVIINEQAETHHVMSPPITYARLKEFIKNFTENALGRVMQSYATPSYTHVFNERGRCPEESCILELNSETFLPAVMQRKAVAVLFHSKQCFFCQGISHIYLSVARILSNVPSVQLVRIDGDLNSLPWQYTVDTFPTIIFFPVEKKADSHIFPQDMPITVQNLLNFIMVNLDPTLRLQVMWVLCNQTNFSEDRSECIRSVRLETLAIIEGCLREWRNTEVCSRAEVLRRLQLLRQLHLLLAYDPQSYNNVRNLMRKLETMHKSMSGDCDRYGMFRAEGL